MEPCPNCGQQVLQAAKSCRHCGTELDDETFFLNEGEMVAEIMALQKEAQEKEALETSLRKGMKIRFGASAVLFLLSLVLIFATNQTATEILGALFCAGGVVTTFLGFGLRRKLNALES